IDSTVRQQRLQPKPLAGNVAASDAAIPDPRGRLTRVEQLLQRGRIGVLGRDSIAERVAVSDDQDAARARRRTSTAARRHSETMVVEAVVDQRFAGAQRPACPRARDGPRMALRPGAVDRIPIRTLVPGSERRGRQPEAVDTLESLPEQRQEGEKNYSGKRARAKARPLH